MENKNRCKQCYESLKDKRHDAVFCSPRCAAQWARDNGQYRDRFHTEKEETNFKPCQECGTYFYYNEYAERGGKRAPQYCSNKCRQKAYRARKGANAGYTGNWDDARNDKTNGKRGSKKDTSQKKPPPPPQDKDTSRGNVPPKDTSREWWKSKDYFSVIGVTYQSTKREAKAAYMKLVKLYHPDTNKNPEATEIMQYVNAAWDKIKNHGWR